MAVLKTAVRLAHRGFESLPLRHLMLTRTLGSGRAAEGLFVFGRGRSRGVPTSPGRNARGSGATGRGVGVLRGVRGLVQYAQPPASTARGSWSSRPGPGRLRPWRRCGVCGVVGPLASWDCAGPGRLWREQRGRLTESGTAFGARNVPFLQMTEVVPQSSGGKRSPRRRSTSPIRPSVTTLRSYSAVR